MNSVIHIVTTIERGGAEKQLLILVRAQIKSGRKVMVIPLKGDLSLKDQFELAGAVVDRGIVNKSPFCQLFRLACKINANENIVHAHLPRAELITSLSSFRNPFLVSKHNAERFFPKAPVLVSKSLARFVAFRSSAIIAISGAVKRYLLESGEVRDSKKLSVIFYGMDTEYNFVPEKVGEYAGVQKTTNDFVIGTIARIDTQKDFPTLLRAFRLVVDSCREAKLVIVGDGPLRSEMQNLSQKLNLDNNVTWVGRVPDVNLYLRTFDVFVLTSLYEGFGLVLLEAIQNDLPIVASNNSAIPEVLGRSYPYLCETGDAADFAKAILGLINLEAAAQAVIQLKSRLPLFEDWNMRQNVDRVYESLYL
jgi:glycosyltransferase involved in cell wall biosynthesis